LLGDARARKRPLSAARGCGQNRLCLIHEHLTT